MENLLAVNLLVLFGSLVALGVALASLTVKQLTRLFTRYGTSFASGVLLTVTFLELIPEAVQEMGEAAFFWVLLSFLATYIFENYLFTLHHHADQHHHAAQTTAVPLVIFGDTIHNLIDGAAIAAAYLVTPSLGVATALSTFFHEVPHEMGDIGVLLAAGWRKLRVIWVNALSALASFLGALAVLVAAQTLSIVGPLLAVSSGMFLYLAASDFLPKPSKVSPHKKAVIAMMMGVLVMLLATQLLAHPK